MEVVKEKPIKKGGFDAYKASKQASAGADKRLICAPKDPCAIPIVRLVRV